MNASVYIKAAVGYENDADFVRAHGPRSLSVDYRTYLLRAFSCWSAALADGLVAC